jgi:ubiquitin-conjugating enzyme E2 C
MNYAMEDTQNSAPGALPAAQAAKLGAPRKGPDAQSTTKRFVPLSWRERQD